MFRRLGKIILRSSVFVRLFESLPLALQVKLTELLINSDRSRILLLPAGLKKTFISHQSFNNQSDFSKPLILGYLPAEFGGWILEYLFQDIASFGEKTSFLLVKNPTDLIFQFFSSKHAVVLSMHPTFVEGIIKLGIPPERLVSYYTHSRLTTNIEILRNLTAILVLNSTEAAALTLSGIDSKIIRIFPAGYDPSLFSIDPRAAQYRLRPANDVLFVCKYEHVSNKHYYLRKAYPLIIALCKALARKSYKVIVLGKGWENCSDDDFKDVVQIIDARHQDYPGIYLRSKLLVTPSLQEGGPVSWLEAMACGCLTLSTCSGFPTELRSGELGSYLMPVRASVHDWIAEITRILELPYALHSVNMDERKRFLFPATFGELAKVLEDLAFNSVLNEPSLSWPASPR